MGTQKNRLNETVLLSTIKHVFKLMGKKMIKNSRKKSPYLSLWIIAQDNIFLYQPSLAFSLFHKEFNNTGERMLDYIHHRIFILLKDICY